MRAPNLTGPVVLPVRLGPSAEGWITGRGEDGPPDVGRAGNLSHRRPHEPGRLASERAAAFDRMGLTSEQVHLMRQVHGTDVAVVEEDSPPGGELGPADVLVTFVPGRAVAVQVADCAPVLLAAPGAVAAVHAGRRGVVAGVVEAAVDAVTDRGATAGSIRAVIGPGIGPCCYEVGEELHDTVVAERPEMAATTTWGSPSLDLPGGVETALDAAGVGTVERVGGCTRCDPHGRWFSHRGDPDAGRQLGVAVLRGDR